MKKYLIKKIRALRQLFVSCRSYSFIDWVQTIGGFLFMMYIPLLIGLIWFDTTIMLKAIATNSVLVFGIWIVDRSQNGS
jgi:hypothetical protein